MTTPTSNPPLTASKAIAAFCAAVATGAGLIVSSELVHGTALLWTVVGITVFDTFVTTLGVYKVANFPIFPPQHRAVSNVSPSNTPTGTPTA